MSDNTEMVGIPCEYEEAKILRLAPDDIVIVTIHRQLSEQEKADWTASAKIVFPDNDVLLLQESKLHIVRPT